MSGWAPYVLRPLVFTLPFDLQKDLEPVAFVGDAPFWILAKKNFPAENLTGFIAWLKANPGKASAGTTGAGGGSHLCGLHLQNTIGTSFQFIPYRGGAPALQDLVGGQIDFYCDLAANSLAQVRAGNVKAFAMMSRTRWPAAPDVPTGDEAGLPGLYISNWTGIWAPAGTPKPVIDKINDAIGAALADPQVRKRYEELGQELPAPGQHTAEALAEIPQGRSREVGPDHQGREYSAQLIGTQCPRAIRTVSLPDGTAIPGARPGHLGLGRRPQARAPSEIEALRLGLDLGMTLIDTAEMYGDGAAEELVAEAIAGRRDESSSSARCCPHNATRRGTVRPASAA